MLTKALLWLDTKGWPQRLVGLALRRRARSHLSRYFFPMSQATQAVGLSVATPLISTRDLFEGVVPSKFGAWRDYRVRSAMTRGNIAMAILEELRSQTEFSLVVPVHADFDKVGFLTAKVVRLTCEAQRARLVTVRTPDGALLAAGTLELQPVAAFSEELKP